MDLEDAVRDSMALLERMMAQKPETVLGALEPAEREKVIAELRVLANQAAGVQAKMDLLYVTSAVHRLVRGTPGLASLLLPQEARLTVAPEQPKRRKVTADYDERVYRKSQYAQDRAAEIRNHVVTCRERLERALREAPEGRRG